MIEHFNRSGSVPVVDAADLKVMWAYSQEVKAQHPGATSVAVGAAVWKNLCSPGADIMAVSYRYGILMSLQSAWTGGQPSENAFKVAARIDLNWMQVGVVYQGSQFNLEQFFTELLVEEHGLGGVLPEYL